MRDHLRHVPLFLLFLLALAGCGGGDREWETRRPQASSPPAAPQAGPQSPAYTVSPRGGTPATGPGDRYNHCERIWCLVHGENFFVDHFLSGHDGWILHDGASGDVYVPAGRSGGPKFPGARSTLLRLCGLHVHPFLIGTGIAPVRGGYYADSVGYSRAHWRQFGTQLDPCCINGMGWDYIHSTGVGRFFRFHDLDDYRAHPERGWQKPFTGQEAGR